MADTPILLLTGPTASGKSRLALEIAQKRGGVIINADSMQIYRELRIVTARPSPQEESRVAHRLYGMLPGAQACSAAHWLGLARMEIDWALREERLPVVVGGTGLYFKTLLEGIAEIPAIPAEVRAQAAQDFVLMGAAAFHERLAAVDPAAAAKCPPANRQRAIRAYEVWLGTGRPLSWWQAQGSVPPYPRVRFRHLHLEPERDALYHQGNARFLRMMQEGALEEVRALLALGLSPDLPVMRAVGVRELAAHLAGQLTLEEAAAQGQQATRRYAKRQMTWFRHQLPALKPFRAM